MLEDIDIEISKCKLCEDYVEKFGTTKTLHKGKDNKILILGEAPANNGWRKSGRAWYDLNNKLLPSGIVMQKLLDILNLKLEDVYFMEAVKCYPKDRKYLMVCSKNCRNFLYKQLEIIEPKIIFVLGDCATKSILDIKYKRYSDIVGKEYYINDILVIPIYHPSPINPRGYKNNIEIFERVKEDYGEIL